MTPKYKLSARAKGLLAKLDPIDSFLDEAGDYLESEMMRFPGFGRGTCAEVKAHLIASGKLVYSDEALLEMTSYQGRLNKFGELLAGMGWRRQGSGYWRHSCRSGLVAPTVLRVPPLAACLRSERAQGLVQ